MSNFTASVAADAEVQSSFAALTGATIPVAGDGSSEAWLRFTGVTIPQGATIDAVTISLRGASVSGSVVLGIACQDADDAATISNSNTIGSRTFTSDGASWLGPSAGPQTSPDFKAALQTVVNRSGWASGNAILVRLHATSGTPGSRYDMWATEGGVQTPSISVDYTAGGSTTPVSGSDTLSLSASESQTSASTLSSSDTLSQSVAESRQNDLTSSRSDTASLSIAEADQTQSSFSGSDTLSQSISETHDTTAQFSSADIPALTISESGEAIASVSAGSDSLSLAANESQTSALTQPGSDTASLQVSEGATIAADTTPVAGSDTLSLSVGDASTSALSAQPSDTATLSLIAETLSDLTTSRSDALNLAIIDTPNALKPQSASDDLALRLTDLGVEQELGPPSPDLQLRVLYKRRIAVSQTRRRIVHGSSVRHIEIDQSRRRLTVPH